MVCNLPRPRSRSHTTATRQGPSSDSRRRRRRWPSAVSFSLSVAMSMSFAMSLALPSPLSCRASCLVAPLGWPRVGVFRCASRSRPPPRRRGSRHGFLSVGPPSRGRPTRRGAAIGRAPPGPDLPLFEEGFQAGGVVASIPLAHGLTIQAKRPFDSPPMPFGCLATPSAVSTNSNRQPSSQHQRQLPQPARQLCHSRRSARVCPVKPRARLCRGPCVMCVCVCLRQTDGLTPPACPGRRQLYATIDYYTRLTTTPTPTTTTTPTHMDDTT